MRLTKIKLAGFKTFVDPTVLSFPSNLTGIIGPNGCGKSNIIDAIRWVMGESSARNLRGDSMEDVIFSGSSSRSEISKAFIELYFDNSNNSLDAKFAKFTEIVIRREVSRDGISNYYLNNTKCRRKDIREVFLGTGLGPRSYAIIEQGMISRLVEAKPEELRMYLEEAAGISKYKEKRRETELRLKHTKDNLNRLNDVMKEIASQLGKLERQAKAANDFKNLKHDERRLKLDLIGIKWNNFDKEANELEKEITRDMTVIEKYKADMTRKDKLIEDSRQSRNDEQDLFNKAQADFYQIGSEIAKCEKDIEHSEKTKSSQQETLNDFNNSITNISNQRKEEREKLEKVKTIIQKEKIVLDKTDKEISERIKEKENSAFAIQNWQSNYNKFLASQLETINKEQIEITKINSYEKSIEQLSKRLKILESDENKEDKDQSDKSAIIKDSLDLQERLSSIIIDFDRSGFSKNQENKTLINIPISIKIIFDNFKSLIKKIKILVRSQEEEVSDIKKKIISYNKQSLDSQNLLKEFKTSIKENDLLKSKLEKEKIDLSQIIDKINWNVEELQKDYNATNINITTLHAEETSLNSNIERLNDEKVHVEERKLKLLSNPNEPDIPASSMQDKLKRLIGQKNSKDNDLTKSRNNLAVIDKSIVSYESDKQAIDLDVSKLREDLENKKINLGEKNAQRNSLRENSDIDKNDIDNAIKSVNSDLLIDDVEKSLEKMKSKIDSLGSINLAAIDELNEQKERKSYLDNQYEDLSKSVSTLENAIKKIDTETKSKFKEIFDQINMHLNDFFTKIFGGGKAYLELTNNDLLNTGVTIMARPPGKLIKNINLLSGGEKAGTGIAFVFSIFKINPAPFCLLDEVDAPLDEANNARFCNVVREMSNTVQFIFITHNKSTMELADILSGVTMKEAGVSKLVSVNINEAVDLSNAKLERQDTTRPSN